MKKKIATMSTGRYHMGNIRKLRNNRSILNYLLNESYRVFTFPLILIDKKLLVR